MSKIFLVILYIYTACYMFWFTGRTVEVTHDNNGNIIQQVYDRRGNMVQVHDVKGEKIKEIEYYGLSEDITTEETYENGRLIKEVEYDPYIKGNGDTSELESTKITEYRYALNNTEVEIVCSVNEGDISDTDSVIYQMQDADNHVIGLTSVAGGKEAGKMVVRVRLVIEYGQDYEIQTTYKSDGTVEIEDSRK